jgi:heparanase 1
MEYTVSMNYPIDSWEFGNTLSKSNAKVYLLLAKQGTYFIRVTCKAYISTCAHLLGNELSGSGIGASVGAEQYGKDMVELQNIVNQLYGNSWKPLVLAPGGFYDRQWFAQLLDVSGPNVLQGMTHHIYNLGAGECFFSF